MAPRPRRRTRSHNSHRTLPHHLVRGCGCVGATARRSRTTSVVSAAHRFLPLPVQLLRLLFRRRRSHRSGSKSRHRACWLFPHTRSRADSARELGRSSRLLCCMLLCCRTLARCEKQCDLFFDAHSERTAHITGESNFFGGSFSSKMRRQHHGGGRTGVQTWTQRRNSSSSGTYTGGRRTRGRTPRKRSKKAR